VPLPAASESAARRVDRILAEYDRDLEDHLTGGRLPAVGPVIAALERAVRQSVTAAVRDTPGAVANTATVEPAVRDMMGQLEREVRGQHSRARRARAQIDRAPAPDDDDDRTVAQLQRAAAGAAFLILLQRARERRTRQTVRDIARSAGLRGPKPTAAWARMVVRTETARTRNLIAADVVEQSGRRMVLRILDGRKGPTDHACERVNGKLATPLWLRRHTLEHPNCTRQGRPIQFRAGMIVTLLA
jgi:hypothetical protein